jgi:hypothetical protein
MLPAMSAVLLLLVITLLVPLSLSAAAKSPARQPAPDMPEGVEVIEHEAGFYYTIKKGDTLWDLSERFSDSPWQWPDLWKENKQIANPHWIYPGNRIRLFRKKDMQRLVKEVEEKGPQPFQEPPFYLFASIDSVGFIRKKPVKPLGGIIEVRDRKKLISDGDTVYIHNTPGAKLNVDDLCTVYRNYRPLREPDSYKQIGTQHYLLGIVKVLKEGEGYYEAMVIKAFRSIKLGDLIMPFWKRSPMIALADGVVGLEGRLLISEDHTKVLGEGQTAFMDRGLDDGVKVGQVYSVYYQEKNKKHPKTQELLVFPKIDIGNLLVIHTEKTTATVLVITSERALMPWDRLRAMKLGIGSR